MPIRKNHLEKYRTATQLVDISLVMTDPILVSQTSYAVYEGVSSLLYGSV